MRSVAYGLLSASRGAWLIASSLVVVMVLALSPAVAVAQPITASGGFLQDTFVPTNFRTVGGVTMFDFTEHDTLSGAFAGTSVINGTCVVQKSGQSICQALEKFTGTVNGASGDVLFRDVVFISATGEVQGTFTIVNGGSLTTLHGHGSFQGSGGTGTYTATLVTAP
jgi:Protein of unknown function (DUF3224)